MVRQPSARPAASKSHLVRSRGWSSRLSAALLAIACAACAAGRISADVSDVESRDAEAVQRVTQLQQISKWTRYTRTIDELSYTVEYPDDWSVTESGPATFFKPSNVAKESITIVIISERTPPLPVSYTYTTLRTVRVEGETVPIRKREPAPMTERYVAQIAKDDFRVEFRCSLQSDYDAVFDHMLSTFRSVVK